MTHDDEREQKFLRAYARELGLEELSSEALAKSLGFDELTPEKLYVWFADEVLDMQPDGTRVGAESSRPTPTRGRSLWLIGSHCSRPNRVIAGYVAYYLEDRTHLGLGKDSLSGRPVEALGTGDVVALPRVGGLHHRYSRKHREAA